MGQQGEGEGENCRDIEKKLSERVKNERQHLQRMNRSQTAAAVAAAAADDKASYLWVTEPEVQTSKVSEKAEASEENPVLE